MNNWTELLLSNTSKLNVNFTFKMGNQPYLPKCIHKLDLFNSFSCYDQQLGLLYRASLKIFARDLGNIYAG